MTQLKYKPARVSLKGEMTKLKQRLVEANTDKGKYNDVRITVNDHNALVVRLKTHQDMLQRKITLYRQNWTTESEQLETQYKNLYRSFQEFHRKFEIQKGKRGNLV